jgi:hypothetical protein
MITKKEDIAISKLIGSMNSARRISDDFRTDKETNQIMHKDSLNQQRLEWEFWVQSLEIELQLLKEYGISEHHAEKASERQADLVVLIEHGHSYLVALDFNAEKVAA